MLYIDGVSELLYLLTYIGDKSVNSDRMGHFHFQLLFRQVCIGCPWPRVSFS